MALTLASSQVTFQLVGALDADRAMVREFLLVGATDVDKFTQLIADITTFITAFNGANARTGDVSTSGVSNAFITSYNVTMRYVEATNIPSFSGDTNLYLEAQLQSIKEGDSEKASTYIPAPSNRIFTGDSYNNGTIDPTDAEYVAYGTLFTQGGGNNAISDGQQYQNPLNVTASGIRTVRSGKNF